MIALLKFARLDAADKRLVGRALVSLVRVRVLLWTRPWRQIRASVGGSLHAGAARPDVRRLAWAIHAASRWVPAATCLTRALALQRLLYEFGYDAIVQVGIQHVNGAFTAHAWTEHNGRPLLDPPADLAPYRRLFVVSESRPTLP